MTTRLTSLYLEQLARILDADIHDLQSFGTLDDAILEDLIERTSAALFDAQADVFKTISMLASFLPPSAAAAVVPKVVPAPVAGFAAGTLGVDHPDKVVAVISKIRPGYLADAAPYIDPRTIRLLAPTVPPKILLPVADELLRRSDYITAASFLEFATPTHIDYFATHIHDDAAILRTAANTRSDSRLGDIVRAVAPARMHAIIDTVMVGDPDLQITGICVLSRLESDLRSTLAGPALDRVANDQLSDLVVTVMDCGALEEFVVVLSALDTAAFNRVATLPILDRSRLNTWRAALTPQLRDRFDLARAAA